jgi:hypothetical protein
MPPPPGTMPPPPPAPAAPDAEDEAAPVPELSAASRRLRALLQLPVSRSLLGDDELYAKIEAARGPLLASPASWTAICRSDVPARGRI